jgi:hypothetical protein
MQKTERRRGENTCKKESEVMPIDKGWKQCGDSIIFITVLGDVAFFLRIGFPQVLTPVLVCPE